MSTNHEAGAFLDRLAATIEARRGRDTDSSYVASLLHGGTEKIARKVGEEAVEVVIAALREGPQSLRDESADLLFHLMVLWADAGIGWQDIIGELERREGVSGHEEKRSRSRK